MNNHLTIQKRVQNFLTKCTQLTSTRLMGLQNLKDNPEREIWECTLEMNGNVSTVILSIFKPGSFDSVNTSLPPAQAVQKCVLAMNELPKLGIPTPRTLGFATIGEETALVCEKIEHTQWKPGVRIAASRILARIHSLDENDLSKDLRELARQSDPREYRTTGGQSPQPAEKTLVHGDYFSVNILPAKDGLCIIDWETFGWGDPMWDLGFLIGADRGLSDDVIEATIAAYEKHLPVNREQLMWHKHHWGDFWEKRKGQSINANL